LQKELDSIGWHPIPEQEIAKLRARKFVDYLGDTSVGKKRLISWPDRFTSSFGAGRPGVTTPYIGNAATMEEWWRAWLSFMFEDEAYKKISPHPKKYQNELSEFEIEHSQSLQVFHLAVFDGILVQMLNEAAPEWLPVKRRLLIGDRIMLVVEILAKAYSDFDAILLQEVVPRAQPLIAQALPNFEVIAGGSRGQDSLVLLRKTRFTNIVDETSMFAHLPIPTGDACVVRATVDENEIIIGSFHSDSAGQMTVPFLEAFATHVAGRRCLLGLDGNMASDPDKGSLSSMDFRAAVSRHDMHSCLPEDVWTTFKARTHVQPQFQKAVRSENLATEADLGPKDHILTRSAAFFAAVERDTTGNHSFIDAPLPTESFPSDHAIVAADILL
jgi:hypothetical protein